MRQQRFVVALHSFPGKSSDELPLVAGKKYFLIKMDEEFSDGWWEGRDEEGNQGIFPASHVELLTVEPHNESIPQPPYMDTFELPDSPILQHKPSNLGNLNDGISSSIAATAAALENHALMEDERNELMRKMTNSSDALNRMDSFTDDGLDNVPYDGGIDRPSTSSSQAHVPELMNTSALADSPTLQHTFEQSSNTAEESMREAMTDIEAVLMNMTSGKDTTTTTTQYDKTPHYDEAPQFDRTPQFNESSQYNEAPRFNEAPRYNEAPRFNEAPRYNEPPRFNEAARYNEPPRFTESSAFDEDDHSSSFTNSVNDPLQSVMNWSASDVADWLTRVGLESVSNNFYVNDINGEILLELDSNSLKELNIPSFGKRYEVLRKIQQLRDEIMGSKADFYAPNSPAAFVNEGYASVKLTKQFSQPSPLADTFRSASRASSIPPPNVMAPFSTRVNDEPSLYLNQQRIGHASRTATPTRGFYDRPAETTKETAPVVPRAQTLAPQMPPLTMYPTLDSDSGILSAPPVSRTPVPDGLVSRQRSPSKASKSSSMLSLRADSMKDAAPSLPDIEIKPSVNDTTLRNAPTLAQPAINDVPTIIQPTPVSTAPEPPSAPPPPRPSSPPKPKAPVPPVPTSAPLPVPTVKPMLTEVSKVSSQSDASVSSSTLEKTLTLETPADAKPPVKSYHRLRGPIPRAVSGSSNNTSSSQTPSSSINTTAPAAPAPPPPTQKLKPAEEAKLALATKAKEPTVKRKSKRDFFGRQKILPTGISEGLANVPATEAIKTADCHGWMRKRSDRYGVWKTRYFVLKGTRLSYYHSLSDGKEKGLIDITSHRVVKVDDFVLSPGRTVIKLIPPAPGAAKAAVMFTPPKVHYFTCENDEQLRKWSSSFLKATVERDLSVPALTTSRMPTISLIKARELRARPPSLLLDDNDEGLESSLGRSRVVSDSKAQKGSSPKESTIATIQKKIEKMKL
ncbi:boi family protein [Schizosaccharomyces japonicus yFS275]|uniref:Boi family protein n=1 Tax=Schizosaccharomyces japonicus (strain yFS275 / FY16936) TaxID=402676 RepID=B6JXY8_SCHJY|nr:boi family protein [Schizosaccharomyces japonicus yFS275]EEB06406.1 boi family protein [Schizosaccharomyces japonicus yFS275]